MSKPSKRPKRSARKKAGLRRPDGTEIPRFRISKIGILPWIEPLNAEGKAEGCNPIQAPIEVYPAEFDKLPELLAYIAGKGIVPTD